MEICFFDSRLVAQEVSEDGWTRYESLEKLFRSSDLVVHTSALDVRGADNAGFLDDVLSQLAADRPAGSPQNPFESCAR